MFSWKTGIQMDSGKALVGFLLIAGALAHFGPNTFELPHRWNPAQALAFGVLLLVCMISIYGGQQSPFLYFQF
jgi:hypothetical protein